jgi:hypothetical protein
MQNLYKLEADEILGMPLGRMPVRIGGCESRLSPVIFIFLNFNKLTAPAGPMWDELALQQVRFRAHWNGHSRMAGHLFNKIRT